MNWKRLGLIIGAGVTAVLAVAVPASTVITVPVLGGLSAGAGFGALSAFLGGWAMRTPGHTPTETPKP